MNRDRDGVSENKKLKILLITMPALRPPLHMSPSAPLLLLAMFHSRLYHSHYRSSASFASLLPVYAVSGGNITLYSFAVFFLPYLFFFSSFLLYCDKLSIILFDCFPVHRENTERAI